MSGMRDHTFGCTCKTHIGRPWHRAEHWTPQEIAFLERWYGIWPDAKIAKRLGRTAVGVDVKAGRLGLRKRDNGYTARELGRLLGTDSTVISKQWIRRGLLKAHHGYRQGPSPVHLIPHEEVERFIVEHGEWITAANVPADSPFRFLVESHRWYSLPDLAVLTGRTNLDLDIHAGRIAARKRGTWWMVPSSELSKIRALPDEARAEAVWRRDSRLRVRRNRRKGLAA